MDLPRVQEPTTDPKQLALKALQQHTQNRDAIFRSEFQMKWVTSLMENYYDLLLVARTGGGKSFVYLLPAQVETKVTIVIQPLKALVWETCSILEERRISYVKYQSGLQLQGSFKVIVVLVDQAATRHFWEQVQLLAIRGQLSRVIIDEAHCYIDDKSYRSYAPGVTRLRQLKVPFVFTTASLPLEMEHPLLQEFNMAHIKKLREHTRRPDITMDVHQGFPDQLDLETFILDLKKELCVNKVDRGMVFIEDRALVDTFAVALSQDISQPAIARHHSTMTDEERKDSVANWNRQDHCIMVATSGFGAGINYGAVRFVVIVGLPTHEEVNKAYQQAGRAGRDGCGGRVLLVNHGQQTSDLQMHLLDEERCPAAVFSMIEDGVALPCTAEMAMCQRCKRAVGGQEIVGDLSDTRVSESASDGLVLLTQDSINPSQQRVGVQTNADLAKRLAHDHLSMVLEIEKNIKVFSGKCGWCFGKLNKLICHTIRQCPQLRYSCGKCYQSKSSFQKLVIFPGRSHSHADTWW